jgi:hypothetical protein
MSKLVVRVDELAARSRDGACCMRGAVDGSWVARVQHPGDVPIQHALGPSTPPMPQTAGGPLDSEAFPVVPASGH